MYLNNNNGHLHVCLLTFQLDLQLQDEGGGDISSFITNGEWDLLGEYENVLHNYII
jgi:hypothetical protein